MIVRSYSYPCFLPSSTVYHLPLLPDAIISHLTPKHHRRAFPEADGWLSSPVGHHPLEGGMFQKHEEDADEDPDEQQEVEPGMLVELHRGGLSLQLTVVRVVVALAASEEEVL